MFSFFWRWIWRKRFLESDEAWRKATPWNTEMMQLSSQKQQYQDALKTNLFPVFWFLLFVLVLVYDFWACYLLFLLHNENKLFFSQNYSYYIFYKPNRETRFHWISKKKKKLPHIIRTKKTCNAQSSKIWNRKTTQDQLLFGG